MTEHAGDGADDPEGGEDPPGDEPGDDPTGEEAGDVSPDLDDSPTSADDESAETDPAPSDAADDDPAADDEPASDDDSDASDGVGAADGEAGSGSDGTPDEVEAVEETANDAPPADADEISDDVDAMAEDIEELADEAAADRDRESGTATDAEAAAAAVEAADDGEAATDEDDADATDGDGPDEVDGDAPADGADVEGAAPSEEVSTPPSPGASDVPPDVRKYDRFKKIDGSTYDRANEFLRDRTYITAREWAMARLCADFRTETGVEMTKIGENLPELVPFMTDTYTPQAVNQARAAFEEKVRKAGATFLYGAMCDFFTAEELDDVMYEATEVAKFLLEVEGVELSVEEELAAEDRISDVMREVREHSAALRHDEIECPDCGHSFEAASAEPAGDGGGD